MLLWMKKVLQMVDNQLPLARLIHFLRFVSK